MKPGVRLGLLTCVFTFMACISGLKAAEPSRPPRKVMFYSQSFGFWHGVARRPMEGGLSFSEKVFQKAATNAGYQVFLCQDHNHLAREEFISQYDAIVFYTTGDPPIHRDGFLKWLRNGGAFVGIHCATNTFEQWPDFTRIIGGVFDYHGGNEMPAAIKVENPDHPATRMIEAPWRIADEIYHFKEGTFSRDRVHVLLSIDSSAMDEAARRHHRVEMGKDYPLAWTNTEGRGRIFYTALGHHEPVWKNPTFQQHVIGGLAWALQTEPVSGK